MGISRAVVVFSLVAACTTDAPKFVSSTAYSDRSEQIARGTKAMVATAHPLATEAGLAMMKKGGNAVDAAVAASFVLAVVRPHSTGIGGGGFLLHYDKPSRRVRAFDFRERAPGKASRDMYVDRHGDPIDFVYKGIRMPKASLNGHLAAGVPGLVAGLVKIQADLGKLTRAQVMAPAIAIAAKGFPVYASLHRALLSRQDVMKNFAATRKIFLPGGAPLPVGAKLIQKDLSRTLTAVSKEGSAGFYKGWVGDHIVAEMKRGRGLIGAEDLHKYRMIERQPVVGTFRDHRIVSMSPPSSGGVHIVQMLNMLSEDKLKKAGHNSADAIHLLAEAMRRAYADRAEYLGDPDFFSVPIAGLTSQAYAKQLRRGIAMAKATSSKDVKPGKPAAPESESTTHLSVVDPWGNAVSSTQTINYSFGSGVVVEGTGIILNDEMDDFAIRPGVPNVYGLLGGEANAVAGRKTMLSSMSPTLVFDPKQNLKLVVGTPGGSRIITATLQVILNVVEFGMPLPDAVHAHRIHHQWLPDKLWYDEGGLSEETRETLTSRGHNLSPRILSTDIQAIAREKTGWIGVSDTRSNGVPKGF